MSTVSGNDYNFNKDLILRLDPNHQSQEQSLQTLHDDSVSHGLTISHTLANQSQTLNIVNQPARTPAASDPLLIKTKPNTPLQVPYEVAVPLVTNLWQLIFDPQSVEDNDFKTKARSKEVQGAFVKIKSAVQNDIDQSNFSRDPCPDSKSVLLRFASVFQKEVQQDYPDCLREKMAATIRDCGVDPDSFKAASTVQIKKTSFLDILRKPSQAYTRPASEAKMIWDDMRDDIVQKTVDAALPPAPPIAYRSSLK